jgi:hypothetical protein
MRGRCAKAGASAGDEHGNIFQLHVGIPPITTLAFRLPSSPAFVPMR